MLTTKACSKLRSGTSGHRGTTLRNRSRTVGLITARVSRPFRGLKIESDATVLPLVFPPLPLGSVRPGGWLRQQMQLMVDGLPGHMHEFYRLVKDAPWLGGDQEYSRKFASIFCMMSFRWWHRIPHCLVMMSRLSCDGHKGSMRRGPTLIMPSCPWPGEWTIRASSLTSSK